MSNIREPSLLGRAFQDLPLSASLKDVLVELGFVELTPIQAQSLPPLLEGSDLVGQSQTGSGKTAAFALPILQKIRLPLRKPQALILCPTRELSSQVAREIRRLGRRLAGLQVLTLSGGQLSGPQVGSLEKGVHIVVGTPGRVLDHLKRKTLGLDRLQTLVLDEADRMLDMGFEEDLEAIFAFAPTQRQTVFFSATFPPSIAAMSQKLQRQAVHVKIEAEEGQQPAIRQLIYEVVATQKPRALQDILQHYQVESAIVFCNQKVAVSELAASMGKEGASVACLHGDLEQVDRDRVMARLRNRSVRILIATDVAARGIDVAGLDLVVNYDLPHKPDTYVHRIGRTGRAGKAGIAVSLVTPRDSLRLASIEEALSLSLEKAAVPGASAKTKGSRSEAPDPAQGRPVYRDAAMDTLYIGGGRKDKLRPGDILGALTGEAGGLEARDIGKIEIHDRFTYVAVSKVLAQELVERLRQGRIKARKFAVELVR